MEFTIELERETGGRWIADVPAIPGIMVYGVTRDEAVSKGKALAGRVLADQIKHGEVLFHLQGAHITEEQFWQR